MIPSYDLVAHVTRFCRALRDRGLLVGHRDATDAIRALGVADVMDRGRVYWVLRSVLVSRQEEIGTFDDLFGRFWELGPPAERLSIAPGMGQAGGMREVRRYRRPSPLPESDSASQDALGQVVRTGASPVEVISDRDLSALGAEEMAELSRIAARMVRALASRPGRRRRRHRRKGVPDLRAVFRMSLSTGGEPLRLPRLRRVPRLPRLLVLLDVSGSMDRHVGLLLQLVYAVAQHTSRVEVFAFSTTLTRVSQELRAPSFVEALRRVGRAVNHWSGGTRIGESLARLNTKYEGLLDRYTTVFVLSDGWDTGDPQVLARQVRRMQRRVRSVVWLNPLLGTPDYQPLTRGLQAVTPYVDHFLSAKDVNHLKRLPQLLRA